MVSFGHTVGVVYSSPGSAPAIGEMACAAVGFLGASVPKWSTWKAPKTKFQRRWQRGVTNARPPTPAEVQSAAIDRVRRLEAAIDALGAGSEEALCLEGVLAQAKRGASLAPVGERLDSTIKYVERCQKRLLAAEDAVKVAISSRDQAAAELEEGQRNLENLRLEAAAQASMVPDPGATQVSHPSHEADQISVLKARISELGAGGIPSQEGPVSLSVPSPDLSGLPHDLFLQERRVLHDNSAGVGPQTRSMVMENMITIGTALLGVRTGSTLSNEAGATC